MNNQWLQHGPVSNKFRQTYIKGFLDVSGNTIIRNGSIHLTDGDISMNGAIFNNGTDIITQIIDTSNNLFDFKTRVDTSLNLVTNNLVTTDTSLNLVVSNMVTTDASLNTITNNLVTTDASLNILTGIVDLKRDITNLIFDGSMQLAGNLIPNTTGIYDIGTSAKRFRSIYVDEAHLSVNTLYIGDTAILGTNANTIEIKADVNQSIDVSTTGSGSSKLQSEYDVSILTIGSNADVTVQATGTNSKVRISGTGGVEFSSNVEAQANVLIGGNLTVTGNVVTNGSQFTVNSTTVTTADNVIVLNKGEVGTGVTSGISGIQIDRGDGSDFQLVFDEAIDKLKAGFIGGVFGIIATESYVDASINTLATRVTTTETDINTLDVSMNAVEGRVTNNETDIGTLDTSMNAVETRVTTTETDIGTLDTSMNAVEIRITTNETDINTLDTSMNAVEIRITTNETDINILDTSMNAVETRVTNNETDINTLDTSMNAVEGTLVLKANLESPTFTGTVSAPTQTSTDNSTKVATTAYVKTVVGELVDGATTFTQDLTIRDSNLIIEHSGTTGEYDPYILLNSNQNGVPIEGISSLFLTEQFWSRDYLQGAYIEYNGDSNNNFLTIGTQNADSATSTNPRVDAIKIIRATPNVNFQGTIDTVGDVNFADKIKTVGTTTTLTNETNTLTATTQNLIQNNTTTGVANEIKSSTGRNLMTATADSSAGSNYIYTYGTNGQNRLYSIGAGGNNVLNATTNYIKVNDIDKIIVQNATTTLTNENNTLTATGKNRIESGFAGSYSNYLKATAENGSNYIDATGSNSTNAMRGYRTNTNGPANALYANAGGYNRLESDSITTANDLNATGVGGYNRLRCLDSGYNLLEVNGSAKIKTTNDTTTLTNDDININGATTFSQDVKILTGSETSNYLRLEETNNYGGFLKYSGIANNIEVGTNFNSVEYTYLRGARSGQNLKLLTNDVTKYEQTVDTTTLTNTQNTLTSARNDGGNANYIEATGTSAYNRIYAGGTSGINHIESKRTNSNGNRLYASGTGTRNLIDTESGYNDLQSRITSGLANNIQAPNGGYNMIRANGTNGQNFLDAKTINWIRVDDIDKIKVENATTTLTNTNINVNGKLTIYGNIEQIYSSTAYSLYVTSIGHQTLGGSSGSYSVNRSVLLGYQAGYNMASGGHAEDNIFIGYQSGYNVGGGTASNANIGIGYKTLFNSSSTYSRYNTIIGYDAGSGGQNSSNTIVGYISGKSIVGAAENALFGDQTGTNITTGSKNTLIGSAAGQYLTTGQYNTLIGKSVAYTMTTANSNTAMGYQSLGLTTGSNNTAYGYYSGRTLTTGSNNIIIGYNSQPSSATVSNEVTIGTTSTGIFRMNSSGATITGQNVVLNFTGQHHNYAINETVDEKGFIVSSTGKYRNQMTNCDECNKYKITINESLPIVEYSHQINDIKVWGVISDKDDTNTTRQKLLGNIISLYEQSEEDRPLTINSLGEGAIWVSNINGPIKNGDYITTGQLPGLGVKQDDDILHSYTVAKVTTDCSFDETEIVPRKKLRYETITKTREKTIEVEKDVFDYWEDDFNDETYYENFERQIIDKVSKIIQEDIITYDVSGIPSVQVIEKTVEEEVPRVTNVESTDASGNITITEVPTMETVSITKTRNIPKMIDVILKDASNNNLLDSQGDPIIKQYQAKKPVYKKEIINETITETYDVERAVIDPVTQQYVYDYETDNSGNQIYVEKYEMKYIIVSTDKFSVYNNGEHTELYKEFPGDFTNTHINDESIVGKTYKMAFLGCTYHCG